MIFEKKLLETNVFDFQTRQAVVFDWHDGPLQGVCAMSVPSCEFVFNYVAERYNQSGVDWRLFSIQELPEGTIDQIVAVISSLGTPSSPVWIPVWEFPSEADRVIADTQIDELVESSRDTQVVICSQNMTEFSGCAQTIGPSTIPEDLFDAFGIPADGDN